MMAASAAADEVALSKAVMLPVVLVCIPCYGLRFVHAIETQAFEI